MVRAHPTVPASLQSQPYDAPPALAIRACEGDRASKDAKANDAVRGEHEFAYVADVIGLNLLELRSEVMRNAAIICVIRPRDRI